MPRARSAFINWAFMRAALILILATVAAAIAAAFAAFTRDLASARARIAGRSKTVKTSFGVIEYAVAGDGCPLLAVHGAGGGFDQGLDMIGALAGEGFRLIAPSRFGYLRSSLPTNATPAMQADAYAQLLDHLGIDRVFAVAISAGAWSALQFAIRHPDRCRALVLLVPADHLPEGTTIHGGALVRAIFNADLAAWTAVRLAPVAALGPLILGTDREILRAAAPDEKARVRKVLEHLLPVRPRRAGMQLDVQTAAARAPSPIETIACPVLAIGAEDDRFGAARRAKSIAAGVRNGRAVVFATGGHALVGRTDEALREITSFLHAVESAHLQKGRP